MKSRFFPKTIRSRIMMITAIITLAITFITVSVCFYVFQSFLKKNQIQSAEFNLQLVSGNISSEMKDTIEFAKWCCTNSDIKDYLGTLNNKESFASADSQDIKQLVLDTHSRFSEEYRNTKSSNFIERVIISTNNQKNYLQILPRSTGNFSYAAKKVTEQDFFQKYYEYNGYLWSGFVDSPFSKAYSDSCIPVIRPIYSQFGSSVLGWLYMEISPNIIGNFLNAYPLDSDSCLSISIGDKEYLYQNGSFIESPLEFQMVSRIKNASLNKATAVHTIEFPDHSRRTLVSHPLGVEGWSIAQILSQRQLRSQRQFYIILIFCICLVIMSLGVLLAFILNHLISKPVDKVKQKIEKISDGDFSRDPSIEWENEIGTIGKGINHLSENIVLLMEKKIADEKQKKDLEYQILQSQINPHFLYNTLNSIKWMATIQNATGIAEMITALARLTKNVSKGTNAQITLKEELDLAKDYFLIQQYRYGGSISIDYQIQSDELLSCLIHRFTLQPIIENALFHGIEPKGTAGKITVKAKAPDSSVGKLLQISITDNGIGMTPELIERVLRGDAPPKADFFKQVGISNVNQRIQYAFGKEYGISITSEPGVYTTMTITLPFKQKEI